MSLPVLWDASIAGVVGVYEFMTGPFGRELVKSWEHCWVKQWNLSVECLTSTAVQKALKEYLCTHLALHDEIKDQMKVVHGLDEDLSEDHIVADSDDDVAVPLSIVIQDTFGLDAANIPAEVDTTAHCVDSDSTEKGLDDSLMAAGKYEEIWAFVNIDECM
ncbi:hypothetical protein L210DRAFT_3649967 [Boletus edulis BED1]|uniref:Uncharacterized protein n=1 Tax=Boletus edulis BED1 TaxID=1328754 RepID=A0AAD4G9V0_BOLED|nr:hypothetical protein L210DRAFT_3649967 [Boletus edulis BED1]